MHRYLCVLLLLLLLLLETDKRTESDESWNTRCNRFLGFWLWLAERGIPSLSAKQLAQPASAFLSAFRLLPRLEEVHIPWVRTPAATLRKIVVCQLATHLEIDHNFAPVAVTSRSSARVVRAARTWCARHPRRPASAERRSGACAERRTGREKSKRRRDHRGARERPCSAVAARTTHGARRARVPRRPLPPAPSLRTERRP